MLLFRPEDGKKFISCCNFVMKSWGNFFCGFIILCYVRFWIFWWLFFSLAVGEQQFMRFISVVFEQWTGSRLESTTASFQGDNLSWIWDIIVSKKKTLNSLFRSLFDSLMLCLFVSFKIISVSAELNVAKFVFIWFYVCA